MRAGEPDASRSPSPPHQWDPALAVAVAVLTTAAPLAIGSVHPWTQLALSAAALGVTAAYVARRGRHGVRVVPFARLLALAAALTAAQLMPLPAPLVHLLSPRAYELRRAVSDAAWMPLTVDVPATALALERALACLGLLLVTGGVVRSRRITRRLLWLFAVGGAAFALFAFVQRAVGAEAIYGLYRPRSTPGFGFFGSFVDVNHAASIFALTALVAAGLAVELRGARRFLVLACALVTTAALLFSRSRGGIVGFAAGGLLLAAVLLGRAFGRARGVASSAVMLLVAVSVALWAGEGLRARFVPATTSQLWSNQKTRGWIDGIKLAGGYALTGVGRGAFEAPLRAYRDRNEGVRLVYPENFVVQYAAEWGVVATAALLVLGLWSTRRVVTRAHELTPALMGAGSGVLAVAVHELMDFGTEMPGVAFPTVVALGLVAGRVAARDRQCPRVAPQRSLPVLGAWAASGLLALWAAPRTLDADDLALATATHRAATHVAPGTAITPPDPALEAALAAAMVRHPADDYLELLAARDAIARHDPRAMKHLNRALELHPANWQAHQLAARLLASVGHPAQAAIEYRLAIENGLSPDYVELLRVLGRFVLDAVPQDPARLVELARSLANIGRADEAQSACQRAADLAPKRETVLAACVNVALALDSPPLLAPTAKALADEAGDAESFTLAARALMRVGQPAASAALIARGIQRHPGDGNLVLVGARLRIDAGDLAGARALLSRSGERGYSLVERLKIEGLLAETAERAGDSEAAVLARARARLLEMRLRETSYGMGNPGQEEHP
jgi:tetratricopeptide (TPR) repeat protein